MEYKLQLDEIDKRIIKFLKKDAKISLKNIADEVGKTETTIRRRIKALENKGIISGYTVLISLPLTERKIEAFIRIDPDMSKTRAIAKRMIDFPEVEHVYFMSGECGIWVRANFADISHLDKFLEEYMAKIDGIKSVINCIILNELKKS